MKAQSRKAFNNTMKSPSPDVAHRSIIANTKSPANEIKEFMRMRQSSTSPKSMNTSFHQINKSFTDNDEVNRLRRQIQQLQGRIKYLQRIKISHEQLTIINQRLNGEVENLKLQLRDNEQRSQSNSSRNISPMNGRNVSPRGKGVSLIKNQLTNNNTMKNPQNPSSAVVVLPAPNDNILREFNQRIVKMSQENKRLGRKLKQINDQKENLQRQNSRLKTQKTYENIPTEVSSYGDFQPLKRYFAQEAERITRYYQGLNESRMSQIGSRMNGVQDQIGRLTQRVTKRAGTKKTSSPYEVKGNISADTHFRSQFHQQPSSSLQPNRYYMAESKYITSPSEFKNIMLDTSPIRVLQQEKERIRRENEGLNRKTADIETQLKKVLLENNRLQKKLRQAQIALVQSKYPSNKPTSLDESNISTYKASQQKIQSLEHDLVTKTTELKFKSLQIQEMQKRLREISMFRETEAQNQRKIIAQEREKSIHYLQQLQKCQQKLVDVQKNSINKELLGQLQEQLLRIKTLYESTLTQHSELKANFNKYLQMVMQIRHSLTGKDMEECLKDIENKWKGYDQLEMEIIKVHECHQLMIQEYKQSILQKQQHIAKLEKQNLLLKQENQQNLIMVQKLQKAIHEYNQPSRSKMSEQEMKKRFNHHQSADKRNGHQCLIRDYINRTDSKLGQWENEINAALQFESQYQGNRNRPAYTSQNNTNKYQFSPKQVESVYRKTTLSQPQYEVQQYSDAEQYDGQHEQIPDEYELMGKQQ